MMLLISAATLAATVINSVQKKGTLGNRPSEQVMYWVRLLGTILLMEMPLIMKLAYQQNKAKKKARISMVSFLHQKTTD